MSATSVASLPRLLEGATGGPVPLKRHVAVHGPAPEIGAADGPAVVDLIAASGLRGRGGAAFPTATKLAAVGGARRGGVVVVNGAEGEPASAKDRSLLECSPHLVLDGALLAARAVRADDVIVCVRESSADAHDAVGRAVVERDAAGLLPVRTKVVTTPNAYLAGEESALVHFLNGGAPKPTFVPPRVFERGVAKRPTLVQNVETLAHLALIARHGSDWFRQAGTRDEPGSTLVTLSGAVAYPGVYEIALGTRLRALIEAAGGLTERVRALLMGGYFGSWLDGAVAGELVLHEEHLRPLGGGLGSGVIVVLPETACPVTETARVAAYMAQESARQCGPCIHGLDALADGIGRLASGGAEPSVWEKLSRWLSVIPTRGACHHPDGASRLVASAMNVFTEEFHDHYERGRCIGCGLPPLLPTPSSRNGQRSR